MKLLIDEKHRLMDVAVGEKDFQWTVSIAINSSQYSLLTPLKSLG